MLINSNEAGAVRTKRILVVNNDKEYVQRSRKIVAAKGKTKALELRNVEASK